MGKNKYTKLTGLPNILGEAEIYIIPKTWEKSISIVRGKYGKTKTF